MRSQTDFRSSAASRLRGLSAVEPFVICPVQLAGHLSAPLADRDTDSRKSRAGREGGMGEREGGGADTPPTNEALIDCTQGKVGGCGSRLGSCLPRRPRQAGEAEFDQHQGRGFGVLWGGFPGRHCPLIPDSPPGGGGGSCLSRQGKWSLSCRGLLVWKGVWQLNPWQGLTAWQLQGVIISFFFNFLLCGC